MRDLIVGAILGLSLGVAGVLLLRPNAESPQQNAPAVQPASATGPNAEPGLTGSRSADEAILGRLASVETEVSRLADAVAALAGGAAGGSSASPASNAPEGGADTISSAEAIRAMWSDHLDELEGRIRSEVSRDGANVVLDSHLDDLRRAREALTAARSLAELKRLAAGEFKNVFKFP